MKTLGPFARVMSEIILNCEKRRIDEDKIQPTGMSKMMHSQQGLKHNIDGVFFLWSGMMMKQNQLISYEQNIFSQVGKEYRILGNPRCSENLRVAMSQAIENP